MTHGTCRLTAKKLDQFRNPTIGNRVRATFTFYWNTPWHARLSIYSSDSQGAVRSDAACSSPLLWPIVLSTTVAAARSKQMRWEGKIKIKRTINVDCLLLFYRSLSFPSQGTWRALTFPTLNWFSTRYRRRRHSSGEARRNRPRPAVASVCVARSHYALPSTSPRPHNNVITISRRVGGMEDTARPLRTVERTSGHSNGGEQAASLHTVPCESLEYIDRRACLGVFQ